MDLLLEEHEFGMGLLLQERGCKSRGRDNYLRFCDFGKMMLKGAWVSPGTHPGTRRRMMV